MPKRPTQRLLFDEPPSKPKPKTGPRVFQVAELNRLANRAVERDFSGVWVEGELSDVKHSGQGHIYFTLNDETKPAQLSGVMFGGDARRTRTKMASGVRVRLQGNLTIYETRGRFQMVARIARPAGQGDLAAQFERLRQQLHQEGLLDPSRKRALPRLPKKIGIATSLQGAALQDVLRVSRERCPVHILVADCRVQGESAPRSIVRAIEALLAQPDLDVLIVTRGGGSAEDLAAFNDESVARALARAPIPTVSAIGHEVDLAITDLVADARAATPSNAAEMVVPDRRALLAACDAQQRRLTRAMDMKISSTRSDLDRRSARVRDPRSALLQARRTLDEHSQRLRRAIRPTLHQQRSTWTQLRDQLHQQDPRTALLNKRRLFEEQRAALGLLGQRLLTPIQQTAQSLERRLQSWPATQLAQAHTTLGHLCAQLDALSPLRVLTRGYAIASTQSTQSTQSKAIHNATETNIGDVIHIRLHQGSLDAQVTAVHSTESPS